MSDLCHIHGFFEGIHGEAAIGWVRDARDNTALPEIRFVVESGAFLSWRPTYYRRDVCSAVGQKGLFGFAAPVAALCRLGRKFKVTDSDGNILNNGEFSLPAGAYEQSLSAEDGRPAHVFLHIPKTAGSSVAAALVAASPRCRYASVYGGPQWLTLKQFADLPLQQRRELDLIIGHLYFGCGELMRKPCRYVTFLRAPIERIKSNYWQARRNGISTIRLAGADVPLHVAVNEGLIAEFDNLQIRMLSGLAHSTIPRGCIEESCAATALKNLRNDFAFVGFFENLAADSARLMAVLGNPINEIGHINIAPPDHTKERDEDFRKIDWDRVRHRHEPELAFYAQALRG